MSNILYSFVGELAKFGPDSAVTANTPDGMRYERRLLVEELQRRGHKIFSAQPMMEETPFPGVEYIDDCPSCIDLVFCEYRWETYKGTTPDVLRQNELLKAYSGEVPVLMYDAAYWIDEEFEKKWPEVTIVDCAVEPKFLTRKREKLLFWTDFKPLFDVQDPSVLFNYGYCGNDYFRDDQFNEFYVEPASYLRSLGIQTTVAGNWIQPASVRKPAKRISDSPNIAFHERVNFYESMKLLNSFICTTNLYKKDYDKNVNIAPRILEAWVCGVPGLMLSSFRLPVLGKNWVVKDRDGVKSFVRVFKDMTLDQRKAVLEEQKYELMKYPIHVNDAADFVESHIK